MGISSSRQKRQRERERVEVERLERQREREFEVVLDALISVELESFDFSFITGYTRKTKFLDQSGEGISDRFKKGDHDCVICLRKIEIGKETNSEQFCNCKKCTFSFHKKCSEKLSVCPICRE